jgi:hypothetical protein
MRGIPLPAVLVFATALSGVPFAVHAQDEVTSFPLQYIEVVGQVLGPAGPIAGAGVSLEGAPEVTSTSDEGGSFSLSVPVAAFGNPGRKAITARVSVALPGWSFTLRNGEGSYALELSLEGRGTGARCRVRTNMPRSMDAVATAIQRGRRAATVTGIDFIGEEWIRAFSNRITLRSEVMTPIGAPTEPRLPEWRAGGDADDAATVAEGGDELMLAAPQAPRPAPVVEAPPPLPPVRAERSSGRGNAAPKREVAPAPDVADPVAGAARSRVRRIDSDVTREVPADSAAAPGVVKLPGPGVTLTDASMIRRIDSVPGPAGASPRGPTTEDVIAAPGECACRIRGTVEISPDHLLANRLDLVISLRDVPAVRDTIQLFMGSPRAFELPMLKCGTWQIEIDAVARREFTIVSADGRGPVDCSAGGLRQLRLVLHPR